MDVVGPENRPLWLRLPFHWGKVSHGTDPRPLLFTLVNVIPRPGHAIQLPRELRLKNHEAAVAERQFARGKVEFPHAAKPLIVDPAIMSVARQKALTPVTKRFSIVQAEDLQIGENQTRTLDDWRSEAWLRCVASWPLALVPEKSSGRRNRRRNTASRCRETADNARGRGHSGVLRGASPRGEN